MRLKELTTRCRQAGSRCQTLSWLSRNSASVVNRSASAASMTQLPPCCSKNRTSIVQNPAVTRADTCRDESRHLPQ